jgi:hypothetical protein
MAKSFIAISKGLGLYDFIQFGKYKGCRLDSILLQDPEYIIYTKEKFGTLYSQEVLEKVEGSMADKAKTREITNRRNANAYKKHGIGALFGSYADNPNYDEDFILELDDIPF